MAPPTHSRVLEINLVSAEDLAPVSKNMKTYAVVWIKPDEKLTTGVDQKGGADPIWNERFTFKVDDKFLNSEDATIVVEIYAAAWVKDALVGSVNVLINDIFHLRSVADAKINNSAKRTVTLQVRRPSGRPQGILKMEVSLVDSSMRSMPQLDDPSTTNDDKHEKHVTNITANDDKHEKHVTNITANYASKISRSQSDRMTELTIDENSDKSLPEKGSMVNGDSLCNSDVGPSASVVAAAIAKGLYQPPVNDQAQTKENNKISEWTKKEREEELTTKLERWRSEIQTPAAVSSSGNGRRKGRRSRRKKTGGGIKLFSCFGNAFQFEISITCGNKKKRGKKGINGNSNKNKICHLGSVNENNSKSLA